MTAPLAPPESPEHLAGLIERVTFHNAESGFAVVQVTVRGHSDLVAVSATFYARPIRGPNGW